MSADIVSLLIAERDRLEKAIQALSGGQTKRRRGRPPKNPFADPTIPDWVKPKNAEPKKRKARVFTAAQRNAQAARMKAYRVAKRKKAGKN